MSLGEANTISSDAHSYDAGHNTNCTSFRRHKQEMRTTYLTVWSAKSLKYQEGKHLDEPKQVRQCQAKGFVIAIRTKQIKHFALVDGCGIAL